MSPEEEDKAKRWEKMKNEKMMLIWEGRMIGGKSSQSSNTTQSGVARWGYDWTIMISLILLNQTLSTQLKTGFVLFCKWGFKSSI